MAKNFQYSKNGEDLYPNTRVSAVVDIKEAFEAKTSVYVAASNSANKEQADFVCNGVNDEIMIQQALDSVQGLGNVIFLSGDYFIDNLAQNSGSDYVRPCALAIKGFGHGVLGLRIAGTEIGGGAYYSEDVDKFNGAVFHVTSKGCDTAITQSSLFGANKAWINIDSSSVNFEHFKILVEKPTSPVIALDLEPIGGCVLEDLAIFVRGHLDMSILPNRGLIGIRGPQGSNYGVHNSMKDVKVAGFYVGFDLGGEHIVLTSCGAQANMFGYAFNDYDVWHGTNCRPITLINCFDEQNAFLPLFNAKGQGRKITMIDFNIEWYNNLIKGGVPRMLPALELKAGQTSGIITYSAEGSGLPNGFNFWQSGSGANVKTFRTDSQRNRNTCHVNDMFFDGNKIICCKKRAEPARVKVSIGKSNTKVGTFIVSFGSFVTSLSINRVCESSKDFAKELWYASIEAGLPALYDDNSVVFYNISNSILQQDSISVTDSTGSSFSTLVESYGSTQVFVDAMGNQV